MCTICRSNLASKKSLARHYAKCYESVKGVITSSETSTCKDAITQVNTDAECKEVAACSKAEKERLAVNQKQKAPAVNLKKGSSAMNTQRNAGRFKRPSPFPGEDDLAVDSHVVGKSAITENRLSCCPFRS